MSKSKIEWTQSSWNPLTGCTKISPGCKFCYAERLSIRLKSMGVKNYKNGFNLTLHDHVLNIPLRWKKPRLVFVNSMSDLFHEDVPIEFILKVFEVMVAAKQHTFQILTKRSKRLLEISPYLSWSENIWMGVSVESDEFSYRIDNLIKTNSKIKFISFEPLLGPIKSANLHKIDWVIVGGESGPGARCMEESWVIQILNKCFELNIPFFFKQWGGVNKKKNGRCLLGKIWDEMP